MSAMATTRRQTPLHIFQDPISSPDPHEVSSYGPRLLEAFGSVTDVSTDHHTLLEPPQNHTHAPSPRKTRQVSSSPPPSALGEIGFNNVKIPPPPVQNFKTDSLIKKAHRSIPRQSQAMASNRASLFTHFPTSFDKENMYTIHEDHNLPILPNIPTADPPLKPSNKRTMTDAAPLRDRSKKQKIREVRIEEEGPLPEPDEMPALEDDGQKPPYSYANLIGMAILRAPNRRLTLAQIYKWISETFQFYRNTQDTGWQNSIRHNLSLSKSFSKQERPKDDPGKGHYWRINPGFEKQYHKIKSTRRPINPDGFVPAYTNDLARPTTSTSASFPPPPVVVKSIDSTKFPEENDLSSDATIPCSDPAAHDGLDPNLGIAMPPRRQIPSSPPSADIKSSPPAPVARQAREDTPPRVPRFPSNSRSGGRKRKFTGLGDSGYYSSIESSAIKGNPLGPLLTSEADLERPILKRGRAEEEIARIRGSSYDSPSKPRPYMKQPNAAQLISSPFRPTMSDRPDGPLTPAIVFKRPALPPASASPNTNLRNHRNRMRELVGGSPDKSLPIPAVSIPNDENVNLVGEGFTENFDVFGDFHYEESPSKPSAKRPRLERAATTTGILADITGLKPNMNSPTPDWKTSFLNIPAFHSPARNESPLKAPTSNPLPELSLPKTGAGHSGLTPPQAFDIPQDDDIFHLLHSDESEPGIDMLQGFEKIGARASVAPNGSPSKAPRPSLTRSSTTRF
ncbi:forkhead box protein J2 [Lindgomyces ingoldianus]|uniref:Forkhead box protein J2 n=1 Tax=Lindgomyces ingoldianus TaxID=673940 RepID=A0ACB6R4N4_9PLEO|nr:forkhead box protein J2 [Lindgomyces ingoldianus]KAF2474045.1 forkhead box protein J2 [Lindgomyces ingoldianus]